MPRHVIQLSPDTYQFDDQPLIHEGIWKAASAIANAPLQMAQLKMDQEDRAQAQEDRQYRLEDRDRAHTAADAAIKYRDQKDLKALQKEKQDWVRNRAKDLSPNKDVPNKGAYDQAVEEWKKLNNEASVAPTSAHIDPSAQQVPDPTQQDSSDADVLRTSLKALGGSPTYTPSPLRPTQMTTGATGTPSRFGQSAQGLPQDNEWTGKPMPQIARSGTSPAAPVTPHRIVMGVDIDEPAPPMGGLVDRQMDMADIPEEFKIRDGAAPPLANNSPAARPQNLGLPVSHTPEGVAPSYNNNAPGVQVLTDPGYSAPTDMAGEQRQAFTNIVNDVRMRADPSGTTYGAGFGYTPVKQQPETQTSLQYFNNYMPTEADLQSADVRGLQQDAAGNAAAQATLGGDRVNQKIYMDPTSIPFRFRNPITRPPVQAIAPPQIPDMYQTRGLSRGQ